MGSHGVRGRYVFLDSKRGGFAKKAAMDTMASSEHPTRFRGVAVESSHGIQGLLLIHYVES